jgi:hypothetical protein
MLRTSLLSGLILDGILVAYVGIAGFVIHDPGLGVRAE